MPPSWATIPCKQLLPAAVLANLPAFNRNLILGKEFFPSLMAPAFMASLRITFYGAAAMSLVAAIASMMRGETYIHDSDEAPSSQEVMQECD